jgi:hypothetical protein
VIASVGHVAQEKETKKGRGEGGTEAVPRSTPPSWSKLFLPLDVDSNRSKNVRNDAVGYNGALELRR